MPNLSFKLINEFTFENEGEFNKRLGLNNFKLSSPNGVTVINPSIAPL
jgi:hypothetical protein